MDKVQRYRLIQYPSSSQKMMHYPNQNVNLTIKMIRKLIFSNNNKKVHQFAEAYYLGNFN